MSLIHVSGWLNVDQPNGPTDPGFGRPGGGGGVDPGYGVGVFPHPGHGLPGGGHPSTGPIYGGGHPGNKPPGRPIIPVHPGNRPPMGGAPPHPWTPGHWEIIDPGWGRPPQIGFFPIDPGFGVGGPDRPDQGLPPDPSKPVPPTAGTPLPPTAPPGHVSGQPVPPGGGTWVPTDPDYGNPICPGGIPHPPIWAWIPAPPDLSKPVPPDAGGTPPTAGTPLPPTATPK